MRVSEIFYSIEGEGIKIGSPEIFVRLANCNLSCNWCDTKYSWNGGQEMSLHKVINDITKYPCKNVSITGGEPLLQRVELLKLLQRLKKSGYWIQINTNGTIFNKKIFGQVDLISMDCKCPSSGMKSDPRVLKQVRDLFPSKTQFKFVVSNKEDYQFAKNTLASLLKGAPDVIFQPQWAKRRFSKKLAKLVMEDHLDVRLILQQQKMIWGEKAGV